MKWWLPLVTSFEVPVYLLLRVLIIYHGFTDCMKHSLHFISLICGCMSKMALFMQTLLLNPCTTIEYPSTIPWSCLDCPTHSPPCPIIYYLSVPGPLHFGLRLSVFIFFFSESDFESYFKEMFS